MSSFDEAQSAESGPCWSLDDYDYHLPPGLIAQEPPVQRDQSRMMILDRQTARPEHSRFFYIPEKLKPGDLLVLNNTRVIPARLLGRLAGKNIPVEILLLRRLEPDSWVAMVRPGRRLRPGARVDLAPGVRAEITGYAEEGLRVVCFTAPQPFDQLLPSLGRVPLPPYIDREVEDPGQYQTVYASVDGSAAAPTAGFHFTAPVFEALRKKGVQKTFVTLHIGPGTFQPVKCRDIREHRMHREYFSLGDEAAALLNRTRDSGGRIVAVGTTACRVLETVVGPNGRFAPRSGWADLFIYPGFQFRAVDAMLTNFHLPRSTLLMLVSALAGRRRTLNAYREAVAEKYRFYSFGDCMLIL